MSGRIGLPTHSLSFAGSVQNLGRSQTTGGRLLDSAYAAGRGIEIHLIIGLELQSIMEN